MCCKLHQVPNKRTREVAVESVGRFQQPELVTAINDNCCHNCQCTFNHCWLNASAIHLVVSFPQKKLILLANVFLTN